MSNLYKCSNCGHAIGSTARFCTGCRTPGPIARHPNSWRTSEPSEAIAELLAEERGAAAYTQPPRLNSALGRTASDDDIVIFNGTSMTRRQARNGARFALGCPLGIVILAVFLGFLVHTYNQMDKDHASQAETDNAAPTPASPRATNEQICSAVSEAAKQTTIAKNAGVPENRAQELVVQSSGSDPDLRYLLTHMVSGIYEAHNTDPEDARTIWFDGCMEAREHGK